MTLNNSRNRPRHFFLDEVAPLATRAEKAMDFRLWTGIHFPIDNKHGRRHWWAGRPSCRCMSPRRRRLSLSRLITFLYGKMIARFKASPSTCPRSVIRLLAHQSANVTPALSGRGTRRAGHPARYEKKCVRSGAVWLFLVSATI